MFSVAENLYPGRLLSHVTKSYWNNNSYILLYYGRCLWKAKNLGYYTEGTLTEVWVSAICRKNQGSCLDWRQQENCCGRRRKGKVSNSFVFCISCTYVCVFMHRYLCVCINIHTVNLCNLAKQILCRKLFLLQRKEIMVCSLFRLQNVLFCSRILYEVFDSCRGTQKIQ